MSKYEVLYNQIKNDIINGHYPYQKKLPSIREMVKNTGYSRTTIESAYSQLLAEGYIVSRLKSGYFVDVNLKEKQELSLFKENVLLQNKVKYQYDFSGSSVEASSFNLELWKKYLKQALSNQDSMYEYGQQQGELILRQALCRYTSMYRGVRGYEEQMIIGSGFQALLTILCGLFKGVKRVGMPQSGFLHAQMIFNDFNIETILIEEDDDGILIESLNEVEIDLLYLNTSTSGKKARALPISRRLEIIDYAKLHSIYIIEDDHNGELRYSAKPIPAMQSEDLERIIYIGSFSKLMIPSLRIAYMILPPQLLTLYLNKKDYYHQNVSKLEQIALAYYIEEGQLIRQLKKLRRQYYKKSELMIHCLNHYLPNLHFQLEETALRIRVKLKQKINQDYFLKQFHMLNGDLLINNSEELVLSFSSISYNQIEEGIKRLNECLK